MIIKIIYFFIKWLTTENQIIGKTDIQSKYYLEIQILLIGIKDILDLRILSLNTLIPATKS